MSINDGNDNRHNPRIVWGLSPEDIAPNPGDSVREETLTAGSYGARIICQQEFGPVPDDSNSELKPSVRGNLFDSSAIVESSAKKLITDALLERFESRMQAKIIKIDEVVGSPQETTEQQLVSRLRKKLGR